MNNNTAALLAVLAGQNATSNYDSSLLSRLLDAQSPATDFSLAVNSPCRNCSEPQHGPPLIADPNDWRAWHLATRTNAPGDAMTAALQALLLQGQPGAAGRIRSQGHKGPLAKRRTTQHRVALRHMTEFYVYQPTLVAHTDTRSQ